MKTKIFLWVLAGVLSGLTIGQSYAENVLLEQSKLIQDLMDIDQILLDRIEALESKKQAQENDREDLVFAHCYCY